MTRLKVDEDLKNEIARKAAEEKKSVRIIKGIEKVVWGLAILSIPYTIIRTIMAKGYRSHVLITGVMVFAACLFLGSVFQMIKTRLSGINVNERVNENLTIDHDVILYTFHLRMNGGTSERMAVEIPLQNITDVYYDNKTSKLTIKSKVDASRTKQMEGLSAFGVADPSQFVIYDYFKPGLKKCLEKQKIQVQESALYYKAMLPDEENQNKEKNGK